ncbi:MAG TPA: hypothetical protein VEB59_08470 [Gemmatimonadales bacterium]|nr:hypothetical protein [Gemmatimonadales bacterium]
MLVDIITLTVVHVLLSLVGIFTGLVVAGGFASGKRLDGWVGLFLVTTVLTNATGFLFPFTRVLPSHGVGIVSLLLLPVVIAARYWKQLEGGWRTVFVAGSVAALYLNVFVLLVQSFQRFPALLASAPTQKEPSFVVTQLLVLGLFVWLGRVAVRGFREAPVSAPAAMAQPGYSAAVR